MRLDKFLADNTDFSRSQVKQLIKGGVVSINDSTAKDPAMHIQSNDHILLEGRAVHAQAKQYFMLNKPAGTICANQDGSHPTVIDLLKDEKKTHRCRLQVG